MTSHEEPLHNLHDVGGGLLSGSGPHGDAAFDFLARLGVRTIISVDGAVPDVERAQARGMRYVHIPVTYARITTEQQRQLTRAVRDLPGPIYLHCHHGLHRGPTAAALIAVSLGRWTPEQGIEFMRRAGTDAAYTGLFECVRTANPLSRDDLDAVPDDFPAVRRPEGMVAAMVEIDLAFTHLGDIRAAGWRPPPDNPDLVPAAEAGRLADQYRFLMDVPTPETPGLDTDDFRQRLRHATNRASELEEALVRGESLSRLEELFQRVRASCKECHVVYRNTR